MATIKPDPNNPNATKVYRIEPDHLGTLRRVADSQNNTVWRWSSAPFGDTVPNEDPGGSGQSFTLNQRFAGQYFDRESGMHYNYNRYYDPATGRYDQSDPIGLEGGINTYTYVTNNPLSYVDPEGLSAGAVALSGFGFGGASSGAGAGAAGAGAAGGAAALGAGAAVVGARAVGYGIGTLIYPYVEPYVSEFVDWCVAATSGSGRWSCTASCNVQVINSTLDGKVPSRVTGSARGKTESEACAEAKRAATQSAPAGTYARHCQCTACSKN